MKVLPLQLILVAGAVVLSASRSFGQEQPPVPTQAVTPVFPTDTLAAIHGKHKVDLFLEIDKSGKVKDVVAVGPWKTCSGKDDRVETIQKAAVETAKKAIFAPARRDGSAVEGTAIMSYPVEGTMPPKPATGPTRSGGVVNGKRISIPVPKYPSKAKKYGLQEEVAVLAQIDEQGNIYSVSAISGHPILLAAAADAACGARFTPTLLAGEPVKVGVAIHFNFVP